MKIWRVIKGVILWSYERGTWQYDLLCFLILVFIFLTPSSFFIHRDKTPLGVRPQPARLREPPPTAKATPGAAGARPAERKDLPTASDPHPVPKSLNP